MNKTSVVRFTVMLILRSCLLLSVLGLGRTVGLITEKDPPGMDMLSTLNVALAWTILREVEWAASLRQTQEEHKEAGE